VFTEDFHHYSRVAGFLDRAITASVNRLEVASIGLWSRKFNLGEFFDQAAS
jgi:hypothetical protein